MNPLIRSLPRIGLIILLLLLGLWSGLQMRKTADNRINSEVIGQLQSTAYLLARLGVDDEGAQNQVRSIRFRQLGHAFLIDGQGTIVSHPERSLEGKPLSAEYQTTLELTEGKQSTESAHGKRVLVFWPIEDSTLPGGFLIADLNALERRQIELFSILFAFSVSLATFLLPKVFRRS